jgi:trehalose 6-phosphate phosphatase
VEEDLEAIQEILAKFLATMAAVKIHALLLDYDGTLAPFRANPAEAVPYPGVRDALQLIQRCEQSKIILVSGRRAKEVSQLLGLQDVEIWGCHGMERLSSTGNLYPVNLDFQTTEALTRVRKALADAGLEKLLESKPTGYAVHWRGLAAEQSQSARNSVEAAWVDTADKDLLRILHFDGGIEICAINMNKGDVVRQVAASFGESFAMAYLGDDITDEDAFQALKGFGLSVLVRETYRNTSADVWIRPPGGVLSFLERWAKICKNHA